MDLDRIAEQAQESNDIELALLLCLICNEHCIIRAYDEALEQFEQELVSICSDSFGLSVAVLDCSERTTLDDFSNEILTNRDSTGRSDLIQTPSNSLGPPDESQIANVVIGKNLNLGTEHVQVQALELIHNGRIFSRTTIQRVPKRFLLIALIPASSERPLNEHLNDRFFISHFHVEEDDLPPSEATEEPAFDDSSSELSVIRTPSAAKLPSANKQRRPQLFSQKEIQELGTLMVEVRMSVEVRTYLHNVVVFMRRNRAVGGGVSARATKHFHQLVRALALLHGLDYITPSLVALAARKIYPHRITITKPEDEWSLQWGSSLEAVRELLEGVTVEDVIEEVLQTVEVPL